VLPTVTVSTSVCVTSLVLFIFSDTNAGITKTIFVLSRKKNRDEVMKKYEMQMWEMWMWEKETNG
jgi:hypothetical protein